MSKAHIKSDAERVACPGHKTALITGATGQDGSYLIEHLLSQKYQVLALVRRAATEDPAHRFWRIRHLLPFISEVVHGSAGWLGSQSSSILPKGTKVIPGLVAFAAR